MGYEQLNGDKAAIEKHFEDLFAVFKELRDYLANIIFCLPSYTQQLFQREVDALHQKLNKEKDKAIPKSKFSFKNKSKKTKEKKPEEEKKIEAEEEVDVFTLIDEDKDLVIRQQKGLKRIVLESEYEGKDKVYLINIENCDIYLPFVMKALYIKNAYNSRIYAGYVQGSSFFNSTNKCTYHVATHQTRIHKANNCSFFLLAKQGPIIEDCSSLKFGPYMFSYPNSGKHEVAAGYLNAKSMYNKVTDFKWLKKEKSPNFDIITDEELEGMTPIVLEKSDIQ